LIRAAVVSLLVKRWGERKQCPRWRCRAAPLEPRRKRRGSDQPLRRAAVVSLLVKRWGERKQCPRWRGRAAPLEPRRERRGSDQPLRRAGVVSLLVKCWGEPKECLRWRGHAALLEPRRKRRGERPTLETRGGGFTAGEALGRAQTVSAMAVPCSTAGAPAQAPGERPTPRTCVMRFTAV
jgi:hypothetical protein